MPALSKQHVFLLLALVAATTSTQWPAQQNAGRADKVID
jgi:hypothetical protein